MPSRRLMPLLSLRLFALLFLLSPSVTGSRSSSWDAINDLDNYHDHYDHRDDDHDLDHDHAGCGTADPSEGDRIHLEQRLSKYKARSADPRTTRSAVGPLRNPGSSCVGCITIDVVFHVVVDAAQKSKTSLYLTDSNIAKQVYVLNRHFTNTPFQFVFNRTIRTVNDEWAYATVFERHENGIGGRASALALSIVAALRVGGPDVLNLFFTDGGSDSVCLANFATAPKDLGMFPMGTYSKKDFVFVCPKQIATSTTRLNGTAATALTHEVGHWLGLMHTFQGGSCDPANLNDFVDDTPQELLPAARCPSCCKAEGRDSCPLLAGKDPTRNFMDYSDCSSEFTPGQIKRMYNEFDEIRRQVDICYQNEFLVKVEILYDDQPKQFALNFSSIGVPSEPITLTVGTSESHIVFSNQTVSRSFCLPTFISHEFKVSVTNGGIKPPGYFKLFLNGAEVAKENNFTSTIKSPTTGAVFIKHRTSTSFFVSGGSWICPSQHNRTRLSIRFDDNPGAIQWRIQRAASKEIVANHQSTLPFLAKEYRSMHARSHLFFDICLPAGQYIFTMFDTDPGTNSSVPTYFALAQGDTELYRGGMGGFKDKESVAFSVTFASDLCFSGDNTVRLLETERPVPLHSVRIGDMVQVAEDKYEPIYSFGHYDPNSHGTFLQWRLSNGKTFLISPNHLIFTAHAPYPIAASNVIVGTELQAYIQDGHSSNDNNVKVLVTSITPSVSAKGIFAPFTPSGTIVVDGILASSFVSVYEPPISQLSSSLSSSSTAAQAQLEHAQFVTFSWGGMLKVSHQWMAHSFEFPHRVACYYMMMNHHHGRQHGNNSTSTWWCPTETYTSNGLSTWVDGPRNVVMWMLQPETQLTWVMSCVGGTFLLTLSGVFCIFQMMEFIIMYHHSIMSMLMMILCGLCGILFLISYSQSNRRLHISSFHRKQMV